ncbi:hypothetical protein DL767_001826 [Monosporascus sp. MG133]|nr:hypothetical protein DL767_001826 [Monosporascus sp. MG133]
MSMSDPFSIASGAAGIISLGLTIAQGLFQIADGIGSAGQEVRIYAEEINAFSKLLKRVKTELEDSTDVSVDIQSLINDVIDICNRVLKPLDGLQNTLKPLLNHFRSSPSKFRQLGLRLQWVSSPDTPITVGDLQPAGKTIGAPLKGGFDAGDSNVSGSEDDVALVKFSSALNDSGEELSEQATLIVNMRIERDLNSESPESAQEIWYDICALQRKVLRLASRMLQSEAKFETVVNTPNPKDYTVGWICAGTTEYVAAQAFLDTKHEGAEHVSPNNAAAYTLGKVGKHNVVIAHVPDEDFGLSSAAAIATQMQHSFPYVAIGLMVSIGGGAPSRRRDIRLGDVVVSTPRDGTGGVFQYDIGKAIQNQSFRPTGFLNQPPVALLAAANRLKALYEIEGNRLDEAIARILEKYPRLREKYSRPDASSDILYRADFVHYENDEARCTACDPSALVARRPRSEDEDKPVIHFGLIASANQLMKDALVRDRLAAERGILCFDMAAAGVMNRLPCLVICGICNYSDSHQNTEWKGYAAMAAAAYAKELLCQTPSRG